MRGGVRRLSTTAAAIGGVLAVGVQAVLALSLWTMTVTPGTATVGVSTTFQFTATSLDALLGIKCIVVGIPDAINPGEVWIVGSSTTASWVASRSGQDVVVQIASGDGNAKMREGDWISVAVAGVPLRAGTYGVPGVAYSNHDCVEDARPLAAPPAIVISEPLLAEPTPSPEPTPTPSPTPTPTPLLTVPSVLPTLPALLPSAEPEPTAVALASPAPAPTATPSPSASASAGPSAVADPSGASGGGPSPVARSATGTDDGPPAANRAGGAVLAVGRADPAGAEAAQVSLGPLGVVDGLSVWAIPGAVVSGPGLLVIAWVLVQGGVAAAWLPAVRRMRGGESRSGVTRPGGRAVA